MVQNKRESVNKKRDVRKVWIKDIYIYICVWWGRNIKKVILYEGPCMVDSCPRVK